MIHVQLATTVRRLGTDLLCAALVALLCFAFANHALGEVKDLNISDRKIITRVEPEYPETLKRLYIGGVVRVEVVVGPSGKVESTQLLGGNPILGQSAMKAVKQWKYATSAVKEKFVVQLEFDAHR
jgi:TonB family protein